MWNFLMALGTGTMLGRTKTARRFIRPLFFLFALGVVVAGLVYASVVFRAVLGRSGNPHVYTHSTH